MPLVLTLMVPTLMVPANTTLLLQLIICIHLFFFAIVSSFSPSYFSPYYCCSHCGTYTCTHTQCGEKVCLSSVNLYSVSYSGVAQLKN